MGFGLSRRGVDFDSIDRQPTYIFFLLFTPENSTGLHLKLLARISRLLKKDEFRKKLFNVSSTEEVITVIKEEDEEF
ncbi:MAG: PTS sugar transporter subunit IIA, partial [Deltaproteobacteria bacterium]|nr:PTS sugar transporter subunit IIA [Deltaproteobacteria bacterium]